MAEDLHSIPAPAESTDNRREALVAAFDTLPDSPIPEPAQAPPAPEPAASGRPRDETGKFVPKAAALAEPVAEPVTAPAEEPAWSKAPASWKAEKRPIWDGLPPEAKEYAFQREEEMRTGVQPLLAKAQFADKMQTAMEPYMATIRGLGAEPEQAVAALMQADHVLRTAPQEQKRAYFLQLAQQYGIQLGDPANLPATQAVDPMVFNLQNELTTLKGTVLSWQQQQEQAQNAKLQGEITSFSEGKEHFEALKPDMVLLLNGGRAKTLEEAYNMALRLDPDLFAKSQAAQQAEAASEKDKAARLAKASAVSPKSATPGAPAVSKTQDRRSVLEEALNGIEGRL